MGHGFKQLAALLEGQGKKSNLCLKKEVSVLATAPHYALFSSLGSEHDFSIHKAEH